MATLQIFFIQIDTSVTMLFVFMLMERASQGVRRRRSIWRSGAWNVAVVWVEIVVVICRREKI